MNIGSLAVLVEEAAQKLQARLRDQNISKLEGVGELDSADKRLSQRIESRRQSLTKQAQNKRTSLLSSSLSGTLRRKVERRRASTIESLLGKIDSDDQASSDDEDGKEKDEIAPSKHASNIRRRPPVLNNQDVWVAISSFFHKRVPNEQQKEGKRQSLVQRRNSSSDKNRASKRRSSKLVRTDSDPVKQEKAESNRPKYTTLRPLRQIEENGVFVSQGGEAFEQEGEIRASGTVYIQREKVGSWALVWYNLWSSGVELYANKVDCENREQVLFTMNFRDLVLPTGQVAEKLNGQGWGSKSKHVFLLHTESNTFALAASTIEEREALINHMDSAYAEFLDNQIRKKVMMQLAWEIAENPASFFAAKSAEEDEQKAQASANTPLTSPVAAAANETEIRHRAKSGSITKVARKRGDSESSSSSKTSDATFFKGIGKGRSPSYVGPSTISMSQVRGSRRQFNTAQPRQLATLFVDQESAHGVVDEMMIALESKREKELTKIVARRQMHRLFLGWRAVTIYKIRDRRALAAI